MQGFGAQSARKAALQCNGKRCMPGAHALQACVQALRRSRLLQQAWLHCGRGPAPSEPCCHALCCLSAQVCHVPQRASERHLQHPLELHSETGFHAAVHVQRKLTWAWPHFPVLLLGHWACISRLQGLCKVGRTLGRSTAGNGTAALHADWWNTRSAEGFAQCNKAAVGDAANSNRCHRCRSLPKRSVVFIIKLRGCPLWLLLLLDWLQRRRHFCLGSRQEANAASLIS